MMRVAIHVEDILEEEDQAANPEAFPPVPARQAVK
jgi:hypothetical protein